MPNSFELLLPARAPLAPSRAGSGMSQIQAQLAFAVDLLAPMYAQLIAHAFFASAPPPLVLAQAATAADLSHTQKNQTHPMVGNLAETSSSL